VGPAASPPAASPAASAGSAPTAPVGSAVDEKAAFKQEMVERLVRAWPGCELNDKDELELFMVKDGLRQVLDLEALFYLCKKPNVEREKAIESFVTRLPRT